MQEKYLSLAEVAEILNLHINTVRRLPLPKKRLPGMKRKFLISQSDFEKWQQESSEVKG
ncbi:MAG: helix-turn-helix domain-containing protein [Candidatus Riflebacteria bacterium]|nr:helix-turn-helix domain-containing protein [Candidatus Riflebacteria bacterium]